MNTQRNTRLASLLDSNQFSANISSNRLLPVFGAIVISLLSTATADSGSFCSVLKDLNAAKNAVRNSQDNLSRNPVKPKSLGDLNTAKANLQAKLAIRKNAEVARNAADSALADHRRISLSLIQKNRLELQKLPSTAALEASIEAAEFLIKNQTASEKKKRRDLVIEKQTLDRVNTQLAVLAKEVADLNETLDSGKVTSRSRIASIQTQIQKIQKRIVKGKALQTKTELKIKQLTVLLYPDESDRKDVAELSKNRIDLVRRTGLESKISLLQAREAVLKRELEKAGSFLRTTRDEIKQASRRISAIVRRNREISEWENHFLRLKTELASFEADLKLKQTNYDSAVRAKEKTLSSAKKIAGLDTLNSRNLAFQKEKKLKAKSIANGKEQECKNKISVRKYDKATEKLLLKKLASYYKQVYIRELHLRIILGYKRKIQTMQTGIATLQSFDCDAFPKAQSYTKGMRRWARLFQKWISERTEKANRAGRLANKLSAEFNKIWNRPRHGLSDVVVTQNGITMKLWDHGSEDGDIVDVYFNRTFYRRVPLTKAGTVLTLNLPKGATTLTIKAVNEGRSSPNTASIQISHVKQGKNSQRWNLKTNQQASMKIFVSN